MEEVQQLLRELERNGWTIAAIADEMGVHRETVARWKAGTRSPHNVVGVMVLLERLRKRQRIPKKRRYVGKRTPSSTLH
ncbi:MAG: helix-turn-helix transcriptional regulator [Dehalococcoidia bacterium]|nr:helix-turn-helix transcriptional regulator [Dehalococcoidia bacterium]